MIELCFVLKIEIMKCIYSIDVDYSLLVVFGYLLMFLIVALRPNMCANMSKESFI